MKRLAKLPVLLVFALISPACSDDDDDGGTQAMRLGVGAACDSNDDCAETAPECLSFKGGYCGLADCEADDDCPSGSKCVTHDDQRNYCFLVCIDKPECNRHRPLEDEANCSSNVTFVTDEAVKACVPPS
jgi:hypothetical protein